MFFVLSKLLDEFLSPLSWALLLVGAGLLDALWKRPGRALPRWRRALPGALALLVLLVFSAEPVANALWRGLEQRAPRTVRAGATYDAVVLLSGMVDTRAMRPAGPAEYNAGVDRMLASLRVLREGRARYVLVSGGDPRAEPGTDEAHVLARELEASGVDPARILVDARSRNTRENAVEAARIVRERRLGSLLLVTSAFHMRRALGCFRAVGLAPDALPVDYRAYDPARDSGSWLPRADALATSTGALRERAGWWIYRARGYATE